MQYKFVLDGQCQAEPANTGYKEWVFNLVHVDHINSMILSI